MKTLTLTQPWATLVAIGAKKIETRSWKTAYRGPLAIHAARGFPKHVRDLCRQEPFRTMLAAGGIKDPAELPLGSVVAVCQLVDCVRIVSQHSNGPAELKNGARVSGNELAFSDYTPGRYAWLLEGVVKLEEPVPVKGALGLWEIDMNEKGQSGGQ